MKVLMLPVPGNVSRTLARELVLEGLAQSVRVVGQDSGQDVLRIEAPMDQLWKLRTRLERVTSA